MTAVSAQQPDPASAPAGEGEFKWSGHMADDVASTYGPEPLAMFTATGTELVLSGTRGNFRLPRAAVIRLGRGKLYPWFFSAVRIHHSIPGFPRDLQFKPIGAKPRDVLERLRTLGYPVG
jgi:hypothetical protein